MTCGSAGIGRQARLRILWLYDRVGSSPISRINGQFFIREELLFLCDLIIINLCNGKIKINNFNLSLQNAIIIIRKGSSNKKDYCKRKDKKMRYDLIVIGGGPAGISSSIYAASRGVKVLVLEKEQVLSHGN